jgi:hypothetical protein
MPKSLDDDALDNIANEVADDDDFGKGLETEAPETTEVVDEVVDDVPEIEEEPEEEVEEISARAIAEKYGLPFEGEDDVEALDKLFGKVQQFAQAQRQREAQYAEQLRQYQYQLAQRQEPVQQKPADTPKPLTGLLKHWEKVPEWDDNWRNMVKQDESGEWVAKPGADPSLPQKIQARIAWEERAQRSFFENPQQFVYETFQANNDFQSAIKQQIEQAVYQVQDSIEAQRVADQMRPHLFNEDGTQNEAGKAYMNAVQMAQQRGIYDTPSLHQFALQAATPYILAQQQAPPPEPKKKKQLSFAKKHAQRKVNQGHTAEKRDKAKTRPRDAVDLERQMLEAMKEAGIDLNAKAV